MNNMPQSINNRSLNPHQLEILFRQKLTQNQIFFISEMLHILSLYMVLDRKMLDYRAGYRIGLSYLQRAVRYGLIAEYEETNHNYIYQLGAAGVYYVTKLHINANILPLNAIKEDRDRILIANEYMIKNTLKLFPNIPVSATYDHFLCQTKSGKLLICYFPAVISKNEIKNNLHKSKLKKGIEFDLIDFVELDYERRLDPDVESHEFCLVNDDMEV